MNLRRSIQVLARETPAPLRRFVKRVFVPALLLRYLYPATPAKRRRAKKHRSSARTASHPFSYPARAVRRPDGLDIGVLPALAEQPSRLSNVQVEKIALGDWLKSTAGGRVIHWYPNPGNAGDSLIAAATEYVFRKAGVNFRTICDPGSFDSRGEFVCYGGGGNLMSYYDKAGWFLRKHHKRAAQLVVLPHTVEGNEDLLGRLSSRVTIICREHISYAHCRAAAPDAQVLAADDLALALEPRYLSSWRLIPSALAERQAYASFRQIFRDFAEIFHAETELTAWRSDRERHPSRTDPPQGDLSKIFSLNAIVGVTPTNRTLNKFRLSAYFFLRAINQFSRIRTDRLHLAIGAAILGKQVELYGNSYYKNRAVYDFSLKSFSNVRFVDWSETV